MSKVKKSQPLDVAPNLRYNSRCSVPHAALANECQQSRGEGKQLSEVRIRDNESLESALRRFKRMTARSGILAEARKREHYEKPSVKRKKKAEAARKRKY